jgi:hypothetical protein
MAPQPVFWDSIPGTHWMAAYKATALIAQRKKNRFMIYPFF